jgi:uncharacterized protein YlxW (UPF0749 family)
VEARTAVLAEREKAIAESEARAQKLLGQAAAEAEQQQRQLASQRKALEQQIDAFKCAYNSTCTVAWAFVALQQS